MLRVPIKKTHPDAVIPNYAKPGDAGLDLVAVTDARRVGLWEIKYSCYCGIGRLLTKIVRLINGFSPTRYIEYKLGIALEIPEGYVGLLFPRSSISNTGLKFATSVSVIDSGYRGELTARFRVGNRKMGVYKKGDRVAQLIIMPYPEVVFVPTENLSPSVRGTGGYGSTGA